MVANEPTVFLCSPTLSRPQQDFSLDALGLNISDDGRVFFDLPEPLALGDANQRNDVYEWTNGKLELVSTGTSPSDSKLLSVSADGKDVFFFTRQKLVPEDLNGKSGSPVHGQGRRWIHLWAAEVQLCRVRRVPRPGQPGGSTGGGRDRRGHANRREEPWMLQGEGQAQG